MLVVLRFSLQWHGFSEKNECILKIAAVKTGQLIVNAKKYFYGTKRKDSRSA